ncbi:hypothetical protein [Yersinia phage fHe-Yen9-04]|uniref:Uncharacterized protein n=2 Tax=Eneladusvirus Yen904 TaxID=2560849 RepID=A0A2C9CWA7_9CAUD|nr:hypothetical protein FDJ41_gp017 [Yersinia phage fHe-Yen9-04]SOK58294.1 hypothetical protein [Yersinia phage fHe-Yen9-04]SOK58827.1 hypothetical protein [Yersinia phage fHe-Yen9-03]VUE36063.1 hypothetical protein [Yersinia phage fHe-Yen9-04]
MKLSFQFMQKRVQYLSTKLKASFELQYTINQNYHLMKNGRFIVMDQPLEVLEIVVSALLSNNIKK